MITLLRQVTIIDSQSSLNRQVKDILIKDHVIVEIADNIEAEADVIVEEKNAFVAPAFKDGMAWVGEPGFEHIETFRSLSNKAVKGGYSTVVVAPTTYPSRQFAGEIKNVFEHNKNCTTTFLPIGSLSKNNEGKDITEMFDMKNAGAVGFSDYKNTIDNPDLLKRAVMYAEPLNLPVLVYSNDKTLSAAGQLNEGEISTKMGLKGMPTVAEEIEVVRNIALARYCNSPIHLSSISTKAAVDLIRTAKKEGVKVTCDVSVANLCFTDSAVSTFDTGFKILPPVRTEKDRIALVEGIKDGTIDMIVSDHKPVDIEDKVIEFEHAEFGMSTLENVWAMLRSFCPELEMSTAAHILSYGAAAIYNLESASIEQGHEIRLTVFSDDFEKRDSSKDHNTKYFNNLNKGSIVRVI